MRRWSVLKDSQEELHSYQFKFNDSRINVIHFHFLRFSATKYRKRMPCKFSLKNYNMPHSYNSVQCKNKQITPFHRNVSFCIVIRKEETLFTVLKDNLKSSCSFLRKIMSQIFSIWLYLINKVFICI